jgi:ribosomal protein S8
VASAAREYVLKNLNREGYMRSMHYQLGTWESFQLLIKGRKTKKTCVEMAGRRTFRMHTDY